MNLANLDIIAHITAMLKKSHLTYTYLQSSTALSGNHYGMKTKKCIK